MKITKDFEGLTKTELGDYLFKGDLHSDDEIDIDLDDRLVIEGNLTSGSSIHAKFGVEATKDITAGEGIRVGHGLKAGASIKAGKDVDAGHGIEAGESIKAGHGVKAGLGIKATEDIKAGFGIEAGDDIEAETISSSRRIFVGTSLYRSSEDGRRAVKCKNLLKGEVVYGDLVIVDDEKDKVEELTLAQIEERLGHKIKIVN